MRRPRNWPKCGQSRETHETIEAIRGRAADPPVTGPPGQEQVYALASANRADRLILEAMDEGAATVSPRGVILSANPRLGSMTGRTAEELVGAAAHDLVSDAHHGTFTRLLDVGAGDCARGEVELTGPDGTTIPVQLAVSGFDLDGTLTRCLVLSDLTAQRHAGAEVRTLHAELEACVAQRTADLGRANENFEAFTYSVSHDLRAPLRGLSGFSEALLEDYGESLDETGRSYARGIQVASERMAALIDGLLRLAQVSRAGLNLKPVNISAEVTAIADRLRSREPDRRVHFSIQDDVWATADSTVIRILLQNLIENAWKFTARRDDATIEFATAAADDGAVCCYVRDDGAGFDPAYAGKLFQPFRRLHAAGDFPGAGIGLASVKRIVECHGGRAWAEGTVGEGATFYFTLGAGNLQEKRADPAGSEQARP